jgi:hypothetical protein
MKKTSCIQLALITAALASCTNPAYWRTRDPGANTDNTAANPEDSCIYDPGVDLWRYSFQEFLADYYYYYPASCYQGELYAGGVVTKTLHRPAIVRGGFGRSLTAVA